jgi:hypothetical protein
LNELGGFRPTYGVELLYADRPVLRKPDILRALKKRRPAVETLGDDSEEGPLAFVHPDHPVRLRDATIPAQTFIASTDKTISSETFESALQQTWNFPEARDVVSQCTAAVLFTDLMSSALPYKERLELFEQSLLAFLEYAQPKAIHWLPTQRIVDPVVYLRAAQESQSSLFFEGAVNVRLFNIKSSGDEMVMDTLGLAAVGLPDLQCHFRTLDPGPVAHALYNLAFYVFQEGDIIDDGHTVQGVEPNSKWRAQHEDALVEPNRVVLDLDPGRPYSAGNRH